MHPIPVSGPLYHMYQKCVCFWQTSLFSGGYSPTCGRDKRCEGNGLYYVISICRGLYMSDLTFLDNGNPNFHGDGLINFSKCRLIYNQIRDIILRQVGPPASPPISGTPLILTVMGQKKDSKLVRWPYFRGLHILQARTVLEEK